MAGTPASTFDAGSSLTNNGTVSLVGDTAGLVANGGGSLTNSSTGTVTHSSGTGTTTISVPVTNLGAGVIEVDTGTLVIPTLTNVSGSTLTGGTYNLSGVLQLTLTGGNLVTNAATLSLHGPYSLVTTLVGGVSTNALSLLAANSGHLSLTGGRNITTSATAFANSGTVSIGDGTKGSTLSINGSYTQTAGSTAVAKASTLTSTASTVTLQGGALTGSGTVSRPVAMSGTGSVQNGSTAGPLNLAGGYSGAGTVKATLSSASIFDQISVTGTANLTTSSLALSTAPGYTPAPGTTFTILSCTVACSRPVCLHLGHRAGAWRDLRPDLRCNVRHSHRLAVPVITAQPVNVAVVSGSTAAFTAAASGYPTPTVQWQYSTNGGTTWANLAGATSTTFSSTVNGFVNGWKLRAVFTNSVGSRHHQCRASHGRHRSRYYSAAIECHGRFGRNRYIHRHGQRLPDADSPVAVLHQRRHHLGEPGRRNIDHLQQHGQWLCQRMETSGGIHQLRWNRHHQCRIANRHLIVVAGQDPNTRGNPSHCLVASSALKGEPKSTPALRAEITPTSFV